MKVVHVLALLVRLFSIGLFVYALNNTVFLTAMMVNPQDAFKPSLFLMPAVYFLIVILLWFYPHRVIAKLSDVAKIEGESKALHYTFEIVDALFIVFGLFLAFHVVSDTVYWIVLSLYDSAEGFNENQKAGVTSTVIEAAIAILVIFYRQKIYTVLKFIKK